MSRRARMLWWTSAFLVLGLAAFYLLVMTGWDGFATRANRLLWRERVLATYDDIRPGMTEAELRSTVLRHGWPRRFSVRSDSCLTLRTPIQFGATNWWLVVDIKEGEVDRVGVRSEDRPNVRPDAAPPDKTR